MDEEMNLFLRDQKNGFSYEKPVTVVLGNEAADLDSMVTAVTYAWYKYLNNPSENLCPVINIPRVDFKLRTEAVYLFEEAGVDIALLLFSDDVNLEKMASAEKLKLILVDHNRISAAQESLLNSVTEIIDHHADEKSYPSGTLTDIRPVGSAATIVAEAFLRNRAENLSPSLGTLLLGTILLDTVNLNPEAGRVTEDDSKAADEIIRLTGLNREKLFEKLQFEKFKVSSLGSYDLLRKDYKEWQLGPVKCGIGAVHQSVEKWTARDPDLTLGCGRYLKEKELDVLLVMNSFTAPEFTRQLVVYIPDEKLRTRTVAFLQASELELERIHPGSVKNAESCLFYNQKNPGFSRKKLQPLLKEFFED